MECDLDSPEPYTSDESEDEVNNEKELANIKIFKSQIEENVMNYEAHVGLIRSLRSIGELEELRKAREAMNDVYPLSPELWMNWLSDEQKICTSEEERGRIIQLFKRAVKEYMSVQVWVEYIMFMLGGGNAEDTRHVCEEALTAVGIHLAEGLLVWQAVALVEQQLFLTLSPDREKDIEEQKKRIQNIFKRQARVPLMNIDKEDFLTEASKWFEDLDPQIKRDLDHSYKKMEEKMLYEQILLKAKDDTEKLEAYRKYIDLVRKKENPAVIQNIYERTVRDLCLNAGMWEEYVRFVMDQFSMADYVILPVCERSQANCPWSSTLFELHITAYQLFTNTLGEEAVKKKILALLTSTLERNVMGEVDVIRVWMAYLIYLRRKIEWDKEFPNPQFTDFETACNNAITFIDKAFGEAGDKECTIARFEARVVAESAGVMEQARTLWNDHVMKRNNNFKVASLWLEFINLERSFGDEKHCRKLYRRALERVWDDVELIGSSFLQFEQELGTLETMMDFEKRYRDRMSIVQKKRMDDAAKEESKTTPMGMAKKKGKSPKEFIKEKQPPMKPKNDTSTPKWKQLEMEVETQVIPSVSQRGIKRSSSNMDVLPPPGYEDRENSKKQKVSEVHGESVAHDSSLDHRTVFLSNMEYNAPEKDVLAVFSDCGEVDNFRLAKDFKGRSKGFGYLVFKDPASVSRALEKDRTPVETRPLFVSRCNPKNRESAFKFSTSMEKQKLFIRGLPFSMNEDAVRAAFAPHGEIKAMRLVTHRNGYSKGTCYIEYHDAQTAENVRQKMDEAVLKDHTISVLISDPSMAKAKMGKPGATSRDTPLTPQPLARPPVGGRQRTKVSFVPRALQRKTETTNTQNGGSPSANNQPSTSTANESERNLNGNSTQKSNEDFRKMFLK